MGLSNWFDRVRFFFALSLEPKAQVEDDDPTEPIPELPVAVASCSTADDHSPDPSAEG